MGDELMAFRQSPWRSAAQLGQLAGLVFPIICVRQRGFALGDARPADAGEFYIQSHHVLLVGRYVFFGVNGVDRALWDAHSAINALIGVDGEEIRAFAETVYRANIHAVGVFATDTGFGNNVGHGEIYS
jgi:hypothetical protein